MSAKKVGAISFDEYETPVRMQKPSRTSVVPRTAPPAVSRRAPATSSFSTSTNSRNTPSTPPNRQTTRNNRFNRQSKGVLTPTQAPPKGKDLVSNLPYLRHLVNDYDPPHRNALKVEQINLALVGGVRSGKSSFINAVLTALEDGDDIRTRAPVGGADVEISIGDPALNDTPTTRQIERYDVAPRVVLWDTWGWNDAGARYAHHTLAALLDGRLSSPWPITAVPDSTPYSESDIVRSKAMHGVLLFVPATEVLDADGYMANAKQWVDAARARGLQCLIVLSHVDKIDVDIATRPGAVFESEAIQIARSTAASLLQVPLNTVYPVKTYHSELSRDHAIDALSLSVLKTALANAGELLRRAYNQETGGYSGVHGASDDVAIDVDPSVVQPSLQRVYAVWSGGAARATDVLAPSSYSWPPFRQPSRLLSRITTNWQHLLAVYLFVVLVVWLGFALYHLSTQRYLVIGLIGVVAVWLVLFRVMPNVLVVKGFRFNRQYKELLFMIVMGAALIAIIREVSLEPVAVMAGVVFPLLTLHSMFYNRAVAARAVGNSKAV